MNKIVEVKNIKKIYSGNKQALKDVSFCINHSELVCLLGANGAGKSTLIHILAGVLKQTSGCINHTIHQSRKIAWVSQFCAIDWYLSVKDNVRLGARLGGASCKEAKKIVNEALEKVDLSHKMNMFPDSLSGGEQRRMQVARALAQKPIFLILDEPTTGLDPLASRNLMKELKTLCKNGCAVLISTHDLNLAEEFSERILFLSDGKLEVDELTPNLVQRKNDNLFKLFEKEL